VSVGCVGHFVRKSLVRCLSLSLYPWQLADRTSDASSRNERALLFQAASMRRPSVVLRTQRENREYIDLDLVESLLIATC
jgi:hypothetical protein